MKNLSYFYKKIIFNLRPKKNLDKLQLKENNLNALFNYFGSDKGSEVKNPYNKHSTENFGHSFGDFYEKHLAKFKKNKINLLEIGTWKGASIASFFYYFSDANIFCIDRNFKFDFKSNRVFFYNCDTRNKEQLLKFLKFLDKKKCKTFDIIIDDGSHILSDISKNFVFFFKFLKPGGFYIIEDYNHPKYYDYLNDLGSKEPLIEEIFHNLEKKKNFKSSIFDINTQKELFNSINQIYKYKGKMISDSINISDIAFIKKN